MIDLRIWRIALLSVALAVVVGMFSLRDVPPTLQPGIPPDAFDASTATPLAKELAGKAANPTPGSAADEQLARDVKAGFSEIDGATLSEQTFDGSFDGEDVHLRNLIATLPGDSDRQIALIAPRDVARGSGAATSIASTAALLEIANSFSGSAHDKTLVFVSTDGSSIGALGARRFVRDYSDADLLDAVIVLSQPAQQIPRAPLVIPWSTGEQSTAIQLEETANSTVSKEADTPAGDEGPLRDLFRLALPSGLGEQAPLIEAGVPAVRLSSDGELPIDPSADTVENLDPETFDRFGRASLSLVLALDGSSGAVEHGPNGYIGVAGNLLPGWTIGFLALALLAPVVLVAALGIARGARSPIEVARALVWTGLRVVPFLGALLVISIAAVAGLMPSPDFPFDPRIESLGTGGTISAVAAILIYCAIAFFMRPLRPPPRKALASATPAALLVACAASLGVWVINPYMGLLVAVGLQAWLLAGARLVGGRLVAAALVLAGLLPVFALVADLASRFDAGAGVWHDLLLMYADGQIGVPLALLGCILAGSGVAIVAVAGPEPPGPAEPRGEISVRRRPADSEREPDTAPEPESTPEPEPDRPAEPPQPARPEPERDPRLWSKPLGSSSPPPGRRSSTPRPSLA
jgi:Peptidase family M28